jgi:outer membrane protein OmpA-like peptidoglycan-associated protein
MQKLLIFLLLTSLYANSSDFSIIINKPFNDALFDVTQDYDRDISAVGFSKNYKQTHSASTTYTNAFDYLASISNAHGTQMHLVKIDSKNATIKLNKTTKMAKFSEAVAVVKTPSNGYFVGGYTLDGSLIVLKLDADANIIFTKVFGTKNYDRMNNLVKLSDGGILAVGSSITSRSQTDNMFETGLGLNDIYLTRFSKDGRKLWSKKYGTAYDDRGIDAVEAFDGSILVLSKTSYGNNKDVTLMRITENGDKIWLKHYKSSKITIPYKIIRLRDNNFVVSLTQKEGIKKEQIRLIKFDLQKNVLIDQTIQTTYASALRDIKEYSDGSLMGVGYIRDAFNTDALMMLLDNSLNLLHQDHYGTENFDMFNALTILNNSQAVAVGVHTYENSQESNMWIVKFNKDGSIAKKMAKTSHLTPKSFDFYNELREIFKDDIASKKIKIYQDLSIEFIAKNLYFRVGEYKLTNTQMSYLKRFSSKLIPFLKKHKEMIKTLEINGHTSSEWGGVDDTKRYLKNESLSMKRSYSTLSYIFKQNSASTKKWLTQILKGSGLSFSKHILNDSTEDREKSRRVSFRIILR